MHKLNEKLGAVRSMLIFEYQKLPTKIVEANLGECVSGVNREGGVIVAVDKWNWNSLGQLLKTQPTFGINDPQEDSSCKLDSRMGNFFENF